MLEPGTVVGLTGPSGAGEPTFGALVAGDPAPSSGRLDIVRQSGSGLLVISREQALLDRVRDRQTSIAELV